MASIILEFSVASPPERVWAAVSDVGNVHERLARGFVTGTTFDGEERTVTFVNGFVVRERIVTIDNARRRLVYSAVGGQSKHHNASIEVRAEGTRTTVVWTTDLLPESVVGFVAGQMEKGVAAMKATLDADAHVPAHAV